MEIRGFCPGGELAAAAAADQVTLPAQEPHRLHIDLAPSPDAGQEAEVRRLEELGARRVNVGQDPDKVSWVVMADPGATSSAYSARE